MGAHHHLSRRDVLASIPVLAASGLLLPLDALRGQSAGASGRAVIRGTLRDAAGNGVAAKMRVVETSSEEAYFPADSIQTMPASGRAGTRYFYARDSYEIAVPPGRYRIEVVRGIAHETVVVRTELGAGINRVLDFRIPLLRDMAAAGWRSGNTHTHYHLELDEDPDDRLRLVPPAEALDVSVISYLIRNDSPYITNRYPIGRLEEFSRHGTLIDMGEEARNNASDWGFGYGHCLFLNIPRLIEPVSTGNLSPDPNAPDFPTLGMLAEEAKRLGGVTVWCHNGGGMEAPAAIALGHVDAMNLGDGSAPAYERYYGFLNCGFRLPASTGTDWWIYDHNRVFVKVEGEFSYDSWIAGLKAGRTFITNGPLLELTVNGRGPGAMLAGVDPAQPLVVRARALSRLPFDALEIVLNGEVVAEQSAGDGREATLEREIAVSRGGWLAARVRASDKTQAGRPVFAHTSPIYFSVPDTARRSARAAGALIDELEKSIRFIRKNYSFASQADSAVAIGRFEEAKERYARIVQG